MIRLEGKELRRPQLRNRIIRNAQVDISSREVTRCFNALFQDGEVSYGEEEAQEMVSAAERLADILAPLSASTILAVVTQAWSIFDRQAEQAHADPASRGQKHLAGQGVRHGELRVPNKTPEESEV